MTETVLAPLAGWESYYVIVGSSAAALTGLQFVVIALINDLHTRTSSDTLGAFGTPTVGELLWAIGIGVAGAILGTAIRRGAFGTPTVVHFCIALLVASVLSAPWATLGAPAIALGVTGLAGLLYAAIVIRRARKQTGYKPVFEDWLFHAALPVVAYGSIVGGAVVLTTRTGGALFVIAAATLLLVFVGIHNAWDTVTWITLVAKERNTDESGAEGASPSVRAPAESVSNSAPRDTERAETR